MNLPPRAQLEHLLRAPGQAQDPRAVFLRMINEDGGARDLTHATCRERIDRLGGWFSSSRLTPGRHVLIASADDQAVAVMFLACLQHGLVAMVVDHQARPEEVAQLLAIQAPDAVAADRELFDRWPLDGTPCRLPIGQAVQRSLVSKLLRRSAPASDQAAYPGILEGLPAVPPPNDLPGEADAYVLFTSGSTARPKGVRITRRNLAAHTATLIARWGYDPASRILDGLPLHHTDGLVQGVFCAWACHGTCVRPWAFNVATVAPLLDSVYRERITHFVAVPTMLAIILQYGDGLQDAFATTHFRFIISAAGFLDERLWSAFEQRFKVRVCNIYGLTETVTGGCFSGPDDASHVIGTVGRAVDCAVRVIDEHGNACPPDVAGELLMSGEHVMAGYLNDEEASAAALVDNWLLTGDIATIDASGLVRIVGRKKNIVITGGLNIQPEEVTGILRALPGVGDAIAFGLPDQIFGDILVACVTARDHGRLDTDLLLAQCHEHLSAFKVPKNIVQLPAMPYGPSGKIALPKLRELYSQAQCSAGRHATGALRERVFAIAAETFHQPLVNLASDSAPDRTPGWDSFAHLSFITGLEASFSIRLSGADILAIRNLGDAERVVARATGG